VRAHVALLCAHGDALFFRTGERGRSAEVANAVADALVLISVISMEPFIQNTYRVPGTLSVFTADAAQMMST
jgi:hypothetical protein